MHRGVKQRCVRCIVQLSLQKVSWQDSDKRDVHLDGPMVFLRACVLGQLQHSHLHQPLFPIEIDQQLQFDRVFTNCKNPLLFSEMIQGEHVRIEIIQLSEDCTGGRVLARYEASAHTFLYPDDPGSQDGDVRNVQLTRRSKAVQNKNPPMLSFSTSTILLEATVHSPVSPSFVGQDTCSREDDGLCSAHTSPHGKPSSHPSSVAGINSNTSGELLRGATLKDAPMSPIPSKTHSEPSACSRTRAASSCCKPAPAKVKFRPPRVHHPYERTGHDDDPQADNSGSAHTGTSKPLYRTVTSDIGLHPWQTCPRRTQETLTAHSTPALNLSSLSSEPKQRTEKVRLQPNFASVDGLCLEHTDPTLYPCSPSRVDPDSRPPFVVRRADPSVLSRRDFCGACPALSVVKHGRRKGEVADGDENPSLSPPLTATVQRESGVFQDRQSGPSLSELYEKYLGGGNGTQSISTKSPPSQPTTTRRSSTGRGADSRFDGPDEKTASIMAEPGNVRSGVLSPARQIEEKLQRLRKECCSHVQHSDVETVVEDNLNEDLNRLRASLAAERTEVFNNSSSLPDASLTVKVGPGDYWSQRMAEYTGHPHRLLFDETLEKIYHRLYHNASVIK